MRVAPRKKPNKEPVEQADPVQNQTDHEFLFERFGQQSFNERIAKPIAAIERAMGAHGLSVDGAAELLKQSAMRLDPNGPNSAMACAWLNAACTQLLTKGDVAHV